ncbi:MAG: RHS repeat-associated core domain-containing protein [Sphingomonadales bacterium]|nr:RHS repeat-associated core domain-containing protein [Sphingomonadales bacterium]
MCTTWSYGDSALNSDCSIAYAYDSNGRLSRVDTASGALRRTDYAHDKGGNRTSVAYRALPTDANPAASDTYTRTAGTNRLASITTAAGTRTISYDARGNTASETRPAGVSVSTSYDGYGRLTAYTRTGDPSQTNVYNGMDDRVAVTSGGTTHRYVYDSDGRVIGEYGTSAADVIAEFIWLNPEVGDGSAYGGDDGVGGYAPLAVASGPVATPTLLWVHGNHLGVPQVYTNASGAVTTPGAWQAPGFPGQSRTLADLYYNRYRDYDPTTGRYIQADPIGLAGDTNPYVYAGGNPVNIVDPDGLSPAAVRGAVAAGELLGEGLVWWCRNNFALCMRTIGPPAIKVARACKALTQTANAVIDQMADNQRKRRGGWGPYHCTNPSCGAPHGGATGTSECPDCDRKRKNGSPMPGPTPRNLD